VIVGVCLDAIDQIRQVHIPVLLLRVTDSRDSLPNTGSTAAQLLRIPFRLDLTPSTVRKVDMAKRRHLPKLQRLGDILPQVLKKNRIALDFDAVRVLQLWDEVVGPQIAAQTRADTLRGEVLFVKVASSVWMQQLHFLKGEIMESLHRKLGKAPVKNIYFYIGDLGRHSSENETAAPVDPEKFPLKDRDRKMIERNIAVIPDQELQQIVRRAMTREIIRRRSLKKRKYL